MNQVVVVIGIGELGAVFARGLLRNGHPVYPVTRSMDMEQVARDIPEPTMVLIAVGEKDLQPTLNDLPVAWRDRTAMLQNELLPGDWQPHGLTDPTVISVWFEKKKGMDSKVLLPSPAFGPNADLLREAMAGIDIPVRTLESTEELLFELVRKNVYIVTTNVAGLITGGTVQQLWDEHRDFARSVAAEVIQIQETLVGTALDAERLIAGMLEAFDGDPKHNCMGRSAPARLARALAQADAAGLEVAVLRDIAARTQEK